MEIFDGFGETSGAGNTPAILVIDYMNAFTDPNSKLGSDLDDEIEASKKLLDVARKNDYPIIFTTVAYEKSYIDGATFVKKIPALKELVIGSYDTQIDKRLKFNPEREILITKKFASAFFGTNLSSILNYLKTDTVIIIGCSTSGCIRATAVDAVQYGYHVIVPRDCVGDRSKYAHDANLYDIQTKYGDVVDSEEVIQYLTKIK